MSETKVCGKCGAKNPGSNNFCEQCGSKLTVAAAPEKPSKPVSGPKPSKESEYREKVPAGSSSGINISFSFSWREIAYAALILITIFTRFHHLGDKPHHHDESMHAFYSWQLFHDGDQEGKGLARARLRRGQDVFAQDGVGNGSSLHFRWGHKFGRGQAVQ